MLSAVLRWTLPFRLAALLLALAASAAAGAPPCLDVLEAGDGCVAGPGEHDAHARPCGDDAEGCDHRSGCAPECADCECCPARAPATLPVLRPGEPARRLASLEPGRAADASRGVTSDVFRPPRLPDRRPDFLS
jgi:hypothetical protein